MKIFLLVFTLLMSFVLPARAQDVNVVPLLSVTLPTPRLVTSISGSWKHIKSLDYGTSEWEITIRGGRVTYTYLVTEWATTQPPCDKMTGRYPCGTWQQIVMNSGYTGGKEVKGSGILDSSGRKFTIVIPEAEMGRRGGEKYCEASDDGNEINCSDTANGSVTWTYKR